MPGFDPMSMPMDPMGMPMGPMGMPMGPSPDELIRLERQRREKGLRQESINQALKTMKGAQQMGPSPLGLDVDLGPGGLNSIGGSLRIKDPLGKGTGLSIGGAYVPGRSEDADGMGPSIQVRPEVVGELKYTSPFLGVNVRYAPRRPGQGGFSGQAGFTGTW